MSILVHIGPPKSGTSALQNWLLNNRDYLRKNGVYYPDYPMDINGVSSGNFRNLFIKDKDHDFTPVPGARDLLLKEMEKSGCDRLLLSSEHFFRFLPEVLRFFPEAQLIAYVRFSLDVLESVYNQSVKRHANTNRFSLPEKPNAPHLKLLSQFIDRYGLEKFSLRPYMKSCFAGGTIVSDFITTIGLKQPAESKEPLVINRSYCFEALEFKRWLNHFDLSFFQHPIDLFLQRYKNGTIDFSLLPPDQYAHYKSYFLTITRAFINKYNMENGDIYLEAIKAQKQKPFQSQPGDINGFQKVLTELRRHDSMMMKNISVIIQGDGKPGLADSPYAKLIRDEAMVAIQNDCSVQKRVDGVPELCNRLTMLKKKNQMAGVYRELALFCERNGELKIAYRLMKEAKEILSDGPFIKKKLAEYENLLQYFFNDRT